MTTQPEDSLDELRKQIENTILIWSSEITGEPREKLAPDAILLVDRLEQLIQTHDQKTLADREVEPHWYNATFGKDSNGFELGHKCVCGFKARNEKTVEQHVAWKLAELKNSKKGIE